ncbi:UDP-glucuronosyltransferase 2B1 isoform X2 [Strongylocentrotus purpuratus]|uniref:UDP-glucuronosyltransferase n=1 Tax=Strongylocentrotus purpuratus TaxID=7668 RepID=A0A7M7NJ66_STRPU|nr:UDP-glucuronosyltransferase 2B1 isoform X2 [Strongylocentrotus purpuratus]
MERRTVKICLIVLVSCLSLTSAGNVLISVTLGEGSHYMASTAIGESLVRRGHNVTVLIGNAHEHRAKHPVHSKIFNFEIYTYPEPVEKVRERMEKVFSQAFEKEFQFDMIWNFTDVLAPYVNYCRSAFRDRELMGRLERAKFDVTILDVTWLCSVLISEHLNTTNVLFNPMASQYYVAEMIAGAPFLPAVIPDGILCPPQKMTFFQRVKNVLLVFALRRLFYIFANMIYPIQEEFNILMDRSMQDYMSEVELLLMSMDPVIDYVVPFPPAVVEVGGLLTRPANPLEKDLDDFMNSSGDDGVIILSLGTYVKVMPQRLNDLFASVFAKLPQKVVWQLPDNSTTTLSPNIRTMGWLPQNDLLGHPKTKLFIYQGGNNGLYEALYHGVPTLVLPVFADQLCVASRVLEKGMGSYLDIHTLTAEGVYDAIKMILSNNTYAETAKRLSAIYRDRPETPAERAAYWVEHVMKFGGKYMESPAKHLSFIQLSLLDVYAFLIFCLIVVVAVIFLSCRCVFRCCGAMCKGGSKKKKD